MIKDIQILAYNLIKSYINGNMNPEAKIALSNDVIYVLAHNKSLLVSIPMPPTGIYTGWSSTNFILSINGSEELYSSDSIYYEVLDVVNRCNYKMNTCKESMYIEENPRNYESYEQNIQIKKSDGIRWNSFIFNNIRFMMPYFRGFYSINKPDKVSMEFYQIEYNIILTKIIIIKKNKITHTIITNHLLF